MFKLDDRKESHSNISVCVRQISQSTVEEQIAIGRLPISVQQAFPNALSSLSVLLILYCQRDLLGHHSLLIVEYWHFVASLS